MTVQMKNFDDSPNEEFWQPSKQIFRCPFQAKFCGACPKHDSHHSVAQSPSCIAYHPHGTLAQAVFFVPINRTPKSFFKALFLGTHLENISTRMSHAKVAPEGLKPQECERNAGRSRPPIPYIPEKDVIQEATDSSTNTTANESLVKLVLL